VISADRSFDPLFDDVLVDDVLVEDVDAPVDVVSVLVPDAPLAGSVGGA
jgi:hypothetical protein